MKKAFYTDASAFRQALESRLNATAQKQGVDVQRLRRQVAFDRLLCRLFHLDNAPWLLKGGYAMELRLEESRTTRDIDLTSRRTIGGRGKLQERILRLLQDAAAEDLNDFFHFAIANPVKDLAGAPYGGARYPVEARMDGRIFARFHLDVATGDPVLDPVDAVRGHDWLDFAGMRTVPFPTISTEQQFAEKLHAYTLPRKDQVNMRFRDLLDMFLLVRAGLDAERVRKAVVSIFERRATHQVPFTMPLPPEEWGSPFSELASECGVTVTLMEAYHHVERFLSKQGVL